MSFSLDVIDKLSALITAAFGLVAALAWNSAIQEIFKEVFGEQSSIPAMLCNGHRCYLHSLDWVRFQQGKGKDRAREEGVILFSTFLNNFIIGYFHTCIQRVTTRCCLNGASLRYCCNHRAVHF